MSGGPWKSEPSRKRARASILSNGNVERLYRRPDVATEDFKKLNIEKGGYAALYVKVKRRGWTMVASKGREMRYGDLEAAVVAWVESTLFSRSA
jgi:hypothetical protein